MSVQPAPKRRSALQTGPQPRVDQTVRSPDDPLGPAGYHRALVGGAAGAMPTETYHYDAVYDAFCGDTEFWTNWNVVDCTRNSPDESISQENASIRVVMDLPSDHKLYPTAYTPGFPTLPSNAIPSGTVRAPKTIPGLPPGYSVALDVHILEDARIMLDFQRRFRGGQIDPKYKWLDAIVEKADKDGRGKGAANRTEVAKARQNHLDNQLAITSEQRPEARLRPPVGALGTLAALGAEEPKEESASAKLKTYSETYADMGVDVNHWSGNTMYHQVHEECTMVNAFGNSYHLPSRESGSWGREPRNTKEELERNQVEGTKQDKCLENLLARTRADD